MVVRTVKKVGFVYKARTVDQVKERANRKSGTFDSIFKPGVDPYKPQVGDNCYRPLPPTWDEAEHYGYTIFVHNGIGQDNSTYLCPRKMLGKACPICEAAKEAKDAGEAEEEKALRPQERIVSYVLDRDGTDPETPMPYSQSWTQDRDVAALCVNNRTGEILMIDHPDHGYDVTFKKIGTGLKTKYTAWAIDRSPSPIHEKQKVQDEILEFIAENPIPTILNFFDYDYLKGVLTGSVAAKDEEADPEADPEGEGSPFVDAGGGPLPGERNKRGGIDPVRPSSRRAAVIEDDPDASEEVDDETPSRPHGRPAAAPHDDDVVEPRSAPVSRRAAPVDPEPPVSRPTSRRTLPPDEEDELPSRPRPRR